MSGEDEIGSVAEEAAKLFGALGGVLGDDAHGHAHQTTGDAESGTRDAPGQAAECRFCPLCRLIRLLDEASPQTREQLTTAVVSLVEAVSALVAAAGTTREDAAPDQAPDPKPRPKSRPKPGRKQGADQPDPVEHIDLDDEADWEDLA